MKKIYTFLIALVVCVVTFWVVVYFNQPVVMAPETPETLETFEPTVVPSQADIEYLLEEYAYCEVDEDCTSFYADCPFGCGRGINVAFLETAQTLIKDFRTNSALACEYGCIEIQGVSCKNNKCVVTSTH